MLTRDEEAAGGVAEYRLTAKGVALRHDLDGGSLDLTEAINTPRLLLAPITTATAKPTAKPNV